VILVQYAGTNTGIYGSTLCLKNGLSFVAVFLLEQHNLQRTGTFNFPK